MIINAVSIKGQLRIDIPIHLDGKVYSYQEFIDRFHNWNILRGLPPIYSGGNMELTQGGAMYYASMHLYLKRNSRGWLIVDRITSPEGTEGRTTNPINNIQFTHPHDLRHGKISGFNPYGDYEFSNVFTAGKRLKLVTGFRIKGHCPAPTRIGIPSGVQYPDGIILVSSAYASQFQLLTSSNIYHQVDIDHLGMVIEDIGGSIPSNISNRYGVSPLMTGDKIAGVLPTGHLIKGTIIIDPNQSIDMIIPKDSVKASGVPYNEYTRFSIRLRGADRISTFDTRLSYQIGQFIPEVIAYRIGNLLREPIQSRCIADYHLPVQSAIYNDSRARVATSMPSNNTDSVSGAGIPHSSGSSNMGANVTCPALNIDNNLSEIHTINTDNLLSIYQLCTNLSNKVWDTITKNTCISLFQWIEREADGSEVLKSIHWTDDIMKGMSPYTNKRLMAAIKAQIIIKIKKIISPPVNGAWGVATPSDSEGVVSVPDRIYTHMGRPYQVACIRFPVRGKSSLVRLRCVSHPDTDPTFHIPNNVMKDVQFGDYDGDLVFFVTDPDIVESATAINDSISNNSNIPPYDPIHIEYPRLTGVYDKDLALSQAHVAGWRSDIGLLCNMRDNLYGSGYINELQCLTFFNYAMQPALSQMDGGLPIARYILENPDMISKMVGIDDSILYDSVGRINTTPNSELRAIRGTLTYDKFIEVVNDSTPDHPHGILLNSFKILPIIR